MRANQHLGHKVEELIKEGLKSDLFECFYHVSPQERFDGYDKRREVSI